MPRPSQSTPEVLALDEVVELPPAAFEFHADTALVFALPEPLPRLVSDSQAHGRTLYLSASNGGDDFGPSLCIEFGASQVQPEAELAARRAAAVESRAAAAEKLNRSKC